MRGAWGGRAWKMRNVGGRDGDRGIMFVLFEIVVQTLLRVVLFLIFSGGIVSGWPFSVWDVSNFFVRNPSP